MGWGRKAINMSKTSEVLQGPEESQSQVYDRLCEAFRLYTPFDPEVPINQWMVNVAFVGQVQRDIRHKLQKLEGFTGMNASQSLEVATQVFVNRDQVDGGKNAGRCRKSQTCKLLPWWSSWNASGKVPHRDGAGAKKGNGGEDHLAQDQS